MDCRVVVEAAVPVYDVETADEAIRIGISKTGDMLNPDLNYVEIEMGSRTSPEGEELPPAFIAADEALVALELEMTVFNVDREEHASRIARKEIGQRMHNVPLKVLHVERIESTDDNDAEAESTDDNDAEAESTDDNDNGPGSEAREDAEGSTFEAADGTNAGGESSGDGGTEAAEDGGEDLLPEFEDMVDE